MYDYLRRNFLSGDPELVHERALARLEAMQNSALGIKLLTLLAGVPTPDPRRVCELNFPHPVGLAAGFDKNARAVPALQALGFAFVEVGTVTPRPQPGNPTPRIWRFPAERCLVNALGFPGEGMEAVGNRLRTIRSSGKLRIPIGVNLGKNFDTPLESAADDFEKVFSHLHDCGDYFVVNLSSPNTPGLRDLQVTASLQILLERLANLNEQLGAKPLLLKIAPDLADEDVQNIAQTIHDSSFSGIVAGNTTIQRDRIQAAAHLERGGLSGPPLYPRTLELLKLLRPLLRHDQVIISAGGVERAAEVKELLYHGASLVQVYTSFIFLGPSCAKILAG